MSLIQLFSEPTFEVELDPAIQGSLKPQYQQSNNVNVTLPIRLFDLLKNLGCVQPRRTKPSFLKSLMDYGYLLERLYSTPELKLKIQETREQMGSETLQEVSELMGIGLSVTVVSKLYDVQQSTIQKIIGVSSTRPDWKCCLKSGESLLVEAKGSSSRDTSKKQLTHAVEQKQAQNGDIKIATATILNETKASSMKIKDPTIFPEDNNGNMKQHVYRANHYASVFSFLGDDVLCLYFEKMAKRLSGKIKSTEMNDKQNMFETLSYDNPFVTIGKKDFSGHLYNIQTDQFQKQFLFVGVDTKLLSYHGFMDYQESDDEIQVTKNDNQFFIHTDGIMIVNVLNPDSFMEEYQIKSIGVSLDQIALSDIDSIRGNSFKRYVKYLLEKCFEKVTWTDYGSLKVVENDDEIEYYIYHTHNVKFSQQQRNKILSFMNEHHGVLVTNLMIPKELFSFKCVNRDDFAYISEMKADSRSVSEVFCFNTH